MSALRTLISELLYEKAVRGQGKDKRVLYHIAMAGPKPPRPIPKMKWIVEWDAQAVDRHTGEKTGEDVRIAPDNSWQRHWLDQPIESGIFLTPNWQAISSFHGRIGHVYAFKVPEWVIKKAGGIHRYDNGSEILISEEIWDEAGNEIEFLGKSVDASEVELEYEHSYSDTAATVNRRGTPRSPSWLDTEELEAWKAKQKEFNLRGLRATKHPEDVIKLLKPDEVKAALAAFEKAYPEALTGKEFKTEWEKQPGERQGFPSLARVAELPISTKDQELLDLLQKRMTESLIRDLIIENLPPWMIDAIKKREEQEERHKEVGRRLPLYKQPPSPALEKEIKDPKEWSGVVDYSVNERRLCTNYSLLVQFIMEVINGDAPVRKNLNLPIPPDLEDIHSKMKYAGRELYLVGGAVRDTLIGKTPKDYDVATNASPEEVIKILQKDQKLKLDLTGKQFGVVRVKTLEGGEYEIATFREDIGKGKNTSVKFSNIENDVKRRDLTINALFYDMDSGEVVDYVGGLEDIENEVIRAVGNPAKRFDEDRLRILRAVRFAGRMGSDIDPATRQAILDDNDLIDTETGIRIPNDRITEEFIKGIKSAQDPAGFLALVDQLQLFDQVLPGLEIDTTGPGTNNHVVQIASVLKNNLADSILPVLHQMRYSNEEINTVKFLLQLSQISKANAPALKKTYNRYKIPERHLQEYSAITNTPPATTVDAFLQFVAAPAAGNSRELMAQGIQGPALGQALTDAEREAYGSLVGEIRQCIRDIILEEASSKEPNLIAFSDALNNMISSLIFKPSVSDRLNQESVEGELNTVLDTGNLFNDYDTIREVHLGLVVNDEGYGKVEAYYVCVPEARSESNLVIVMDVPRGYETVEGFKDWLEVELEDALSHELQHSCDPTDMLAADIPEGEAKWESLENISKHFGSDAEIRGNVAGIVGRARRSGRDVMDIFQDKMMEIFEEASARGFSEEELKPIIKDLAQKWNEYLASAT